MREAIKTRLTSELSDLSGRCYDFGGQPAGAVKPYATVRLAEQWNDSLWVGKMNRFEVALYGEKNTAADLDRWTDQAIQAMNGVISTRKRSESVCHVGNCDSLVHMESVL